MKKIISIILLALLITTSLAQTDIFSTRIYAASSDNEYNLPDDVNDGIMLHAYNWNFNFIKSNLKEIAEAGYNAIQVSPVQRTKATGEWWLMYQPCNYHVGNKQLGTYEDFKSLCSEAEKYNIKIIVDAVLNHIADNGNAGQWADAIDSELKKPELYHNQGNCTNYTNRWDVTQKNLGNGPDLATQRSDVQNMHINFLNECIDAGADGFRFDAAKHIETNGGQDKAINCTSNYWDNVLGSLHNKNNLYLYGEVIGDSADNGLEYLKYFDITAHSYGGILRNSVINKNLYNYIDIYNGQNKLEPQKTLCYVENHDDFDGEKHPSRPMSYDDRKFASAILHSRAKLTPLLLARPYENLWKDSDLVEVNKFRNAMSQLEANEYIRTLRSETTMIERGNNGICIVNLGGDFYLDSKTNLEDGSYTNKTKIGGTYTVSNDRISGFIPSRSIVVLYNDEYIPVDPIEPVDPVNPVDIIKYSSENNKVTITYNCQNSSTNNSSNMKIHYGYDGWKKVQDINMAKKNTNIWEVTLDIPTDLTKQLDFVFTNGSIWDNNNNKNWSINKESLNIVEPINNETIDVKFIINNAYTNIGDEIYIIGNTKELGNWNISKAIKASCIGTYPNWSVTITLPANTNIEFKALKIDKNGKETWQNGSNNKASIKNTTTQELSTTWK